MKQKPNSSPGPTLTLTLLRHFWKDLWKDVSAIFAISRMACICSFQIGAKSADILRKHLLGYYVCCIWQTGSCELEYQKLVEHGVFVIVAIQCPQVTACWLQLQLICLLCQIWQMQEFTVLNIHIAIFSHFG